MINLRKLIIAASFAGILVSYEAAAQFHSSGDDPASAKWMESSSAHYRIIYPAGLDSLARVYAAELERFYSAESWSSGYTPSQQYRKKMPVVLHPWTGYSNGSVTWAPRRMDLFTTPDNSGMDPMPWATNLAVHESRHSSQMQVGKDGVFRPLNWLFGEVVPGVVSAVYPSTYFLEGDAVVAETALTEGGRGRQGDFFAYYMAAFDRGDWRDWAKWRWGSYRKYAPDHYALGYLTIAGARWQYDDPLFTADYFNTIKRRPLRLNNLPKAYKKRSGKKFKAAFRDVMEAFHGVWSENMEKRAPFIEGERVSALPSWYTAYTNLCVTDDGILAARSGKTYAEDLVFFGKDGETVIRPLSGGSGKMSMAGDVLYLSEMLPDIRYGLKQTSVIRYMSMKDGKFHDLTSGTRLYNAEVSPDGSVVVATDYPVSGGSALVILDASTGRDIRRIDAPDSLQFNEAVFDGDCLIVSGVSAAGCGLYLIDRDGEMMDLLPPVSASLTGLLSAEEGIYFMSDRPGVTEVYLLDRDGALFQKTSTRYGVADFDLGDGEMFYVLREYEGENLFKIGTEKLLHKEVSREYVYRDPVAETLAMQERELAGDAAWPEVAAPVEMTAPKRYSKLLGIPHVHSWVPLSISYDAINDLSADELYEKASIGATVMFQNLLGTASGIASYEYIRDNRRRSRHAGHLQFTYSGLFPVFELSLDFNDRDAIQYSVARTSFGKVTTEGLSGRYLDSPHVKGDLKVYVPLNFSSGGWSKGLIPQVKYSFSNDYLNKTRADVVIREPLGMIASGTGLGNVELGKNIPVHSVTASLRGYVMRNKAEAAVYPKLGVGLELGYKTMVGLDDMFSSSIFGHAYGYLPGLALNQGLKLSATYQYNNGAAFGGQHLNLIPRGYDSSALENFAGTYAPHQVFASADYAIPFSLGDISAFNPLFYITHFTFTPYFDWFNMTLGNGLEGYMNVCSAGADFTVNLANLAWIPYGTEIGVRYSRTFGPSVGTLNGMGAGIEANYLGLLMNIDF